MSYWQNKFADDLMYQFENGARKNFVEDACELEVLAGCRGVECNTHRIKIS